MPRLPINYANTHFYKLVCKNTNITDCYIGHTTDFKRRKSEHKCTSTNQNDQKYNSRLYKFIRDNEGFNNFDMILIETISCNNVLEAKREERQFIEHYKPSLNSSIPLRSYEEYRAENKDMLIIRDKEYHEENKVRIALRKKEHRQQHPEKYALQDKTTYENNKETILKYHKEYRKANSETIKLKSAIYREENRERLNARKRELRQLKKEVVT